MKAQIKKSASWIGSQLIRPYTHVFKTVKDAARRSVDMKNEVNATIDRLSNPPTPAYIEAGRGIEDDANRFEAVRKAAGRSEEDLAKIAATLRREQIAWGVLAALMPTIAFGLIIGGPSWVQTWCGVMLLGASTIPTAGLLKAALQRTQIHLRALISLRTFWQRQDRIALILDPWRNPA